MAMMQKHKSEVLDSKRMAVQWEAQWEKFRQALGQALGIFSLTEDPTHPLMWSHYASQHYGVVVEFDEKHRWFDRFKRAKLVGGGRIEIAGANS